MYRRTLLKMRKNQYYFFDTIGICAAIILAALGLEGFLIPNGFFDGGVTGVSMFLSEITKISLPVFIVVVNIPFVFIGWKNLNRKSVAKSIATIIFLSVVLFLFDFPVFTKDKVLSSFFGGFFLGSGIGFAVRSGAVLDGTELMALILSRKTGISIGSIIFIFNAIIFSVVGGVLGLERAMYSILTYIVASRSINFIIHGIEEYVAINIISSKSEKIQELVMRDFAVGMTIYKGKRGMSKVDQDILFCVITRFELQKILRLVRSIDPKAFIVSHVVDNTFGGFGGFTRARKERF